MDARAWAMLIALSLLWGGSFFLGEVALRDFGPFSVAFARVAIAAAALTALHLCSRHAFPRGIRLWRDLLILGAINNALPFSLILWGQTQITGALASILNATTPLFTMLLASVLISDERFTPGRLLGMLLGVAGVSIMLGAEVLRELGGQAWAQLAILLAALSYACAAVFGRRFRGIAPLSIATGQTICSSVVMLPLMLLMAESWYPQNGVSSILALVGLGVLSTALAYLLYFRILASAGATNLMLVTFLIPVSAIALGWSILGERLTAEQTSGMTLIALGLAAIDGRLATSARRRLRAAVKPGV
jgi:drug/metabolite transporter (DMT)-like permease